MIATVCRMYQRYFGLVCWLLLSPITLAATPSSYGPIQAGERLWDIASQVQPAANSSHSQRLIALLALNPQAFSHPCNLNGLQIRALLTLPSPAQLNLINPQHAQQEFQRQTEQWQRWRRQPDKLTCSTRFQDWQQQLTQFAAPTKMQLATQPSTPTLEPNNQVMLSTELQVSSPPAILTVKPVQPPTTLPASPLRWLLVLITALTSVLVFLLWQAFLDSDKEVMHVLQQPKSDTKPQPTL